MATACGFSCVKFFLFIVNFQILLSSCAVVAVGVLVSMSFREYPDIFKDTFYTAAPTTIILIGVVAVIAAISGCCATVGDSWLILVVYGVVMACILIAEVVVGAMALAKVTETEDLVSRELKELFNSKVVLINAKSKVIDDIQYEFECCGLDSAMDYSLTQLPQSCCNQASTPVLLIGCKLSTAWSEGCSQKFISSVEYNMYVVGCVTLGSAALQLVVVILTFYRVHFNTVHNDTTDKPNFYIHF